MSVITVTGLIGTAAPEVGSAVAHMLKSDYVDYHILAQSAKRIGATVPAVISKTEHVPTARNRISIFIQKVLERSAAAGTGGDPYFGPSLEILLEREYGEMIRSPITRSQEIEDSHFIEVTHGVISDLAKAGNVVIMGRGANIILNDWPAVIHVGLASDYESRVAYVMARENLDRSEAVEYVREHDKARIMYFKKFFGVSIDNPINYHISVNTSKCSINETAKIIAAATSQINV